MRKEFAEKLEKAIELQLPFVLYKKPNAAEICLLVQDNSGSYRFLMHSFDSEIEKSISDQTPLSILVDQFDFETKLNLETAANWSELNQTEYQTIIEKIIHEIRSTSTRKIVISRRKQIENSGYNVLKSYRNLAVQHPGALVYLWHNPKEETWMGATPELLLSQIGNQIQTVSLAGTKLPESQWTDKELDEQNIVTEFILNQISEVENIQTRGPETIQAGKFQHLKTYISGEISPNFPIEALLEKLHPTPAVCGLPKMEAFQFIIENEGYSRGFYAGYLGIENENSKEYYVNLRSGQFFQDKVWLYVGGGITAESNPEKEWKETELKSGTLQNALEK